MYMLYMLYVRSSRTLRILYTTLYNLSYYSSLHSSTGSILDRASINQLATSDSSPSSRNIVLKLSVTLRSIVSRTFKISLVYNQSAY